MEDPDIELFALRRATLTKMLVDGSGLINSTTRNFPPANECVSLFLDYLDLCQDGDYMLEVASEDLMKSSIALTVAGMGGLKELFNKNKFLYKKNFLLLNLPAETRARVKALHRLMDSTAID